MTDPSKPRATKSEAEGHREELLDQALEQTFPASDPLASNVFSEPAANEAPKVAEHVQKRPSGKDRA